MKFHGKWDMQRTPENATQFADLLQKNYPEETNGVSRNPRPENKFWIVENDGQKVGTICSSDTGVVLQVGKEKLPHLALDELKQKMKVSFAGKDVVATEKQLDEVHGFPKTEKPGSQETERKLPLYTKTEGSQSFKVLDIFALSLTMVGCLHCPQLITLGRNEFMGPLRKN